MTVGNAVMNECVKTRQYALAWLASAGSHYARYSNPIQIQSVHFKILIHSTEPKSATCHPLIQNISKRLTFILHLSLPTMPPHVQTLLSPHPPAGTTPAPALCVGPGSLPYSTSISPGLCCIYPGTSSNDPVLGVLDAFGEAFLLGYEGVCADGDEMAC